MAKQRPTDWLKKEMFTVAKGDSSFTLRPEGTAGIARAYLQAGYDKTAPVQRLYHVGPMFRYDRPQAGRYRQFWQFLDGEFDLGHARDRALFATRQLAKRQITWLRSETDLFFVDPLEDGTIDAISRFLARSL